MVVIYIVASILSGDLCANTMSQFLVFLNFTAQYDVSKKHRTIAFILFQHFWLGTVVFLQNILFKLYLYVLEGSLYVP